VTRCLLPVSTSDTSLAWGGDRNGKLSCLQISHPKSASWLNRAIWLVLSRPNACCLLRVGAQTDVILRSRCGILPDLAVDVRQIDPLSIQRPTRSSPTSKTFGRTIGCGHAIAVRSTRSWREMDSNCRFRITNCWRRGPEKGEDGRAQNAGITGAGTTCSSTPRTPGIVSAATRSACLFSPGSSSEIQK
jgi:hypothetical protein